MDVLGNKLITDALAVKIWSATALPGNTGREVD